MKKVFVIFLFFSLNSCVFSQTKKEKIHWVTFEEAVKLNEKHPRKFFIDLYTNWCGWCKRMDAGTFQDSVIVKYLNEKYYAIKFNAEMKDTIRFQGKSFVFNPQFRAHEFALSLMNGKIAGYPTSVYLDEKYNVLTSVSSYLTAAQLEPILKYFGENKNKVVNWEDFQKSFIGTVK